MYLQSAGAWGPQHRKAPLSWKNHLALQWRGVESTWEELEARTCPGPGGPPGTRRIGESFWLEGGAVWSVSLLGFRERKQDCPTIPRRGRSRGGWVGTWHSGSGDPGACSGLGTPTRSKLLVTCGQGALRMGRMQRAGTSSWGASRAPCSSASQRGQ